MPVRAGLWTALSLAIGLAAAAPAWADFSACESALATTNVDQQIVLYTDCITKGGLGIQDRAGAYNNRGIAYEKKGDVDRALADYESGIQSDSTWGTSYFNRGRIRLRRDDLAGAQADFDKALKYPPGRMHGEAYVLRAWVKALQHECAGAAADFEQAGKRDKKAIDSYGGGARILGSCQASGLAQ